MTTAGEALNPEVFRQFEKATGLKIMEGFGQTETTLTIGNLYGTVPKIGSMGKASPQYDVDIVDPDGNPVEGAFVQFCDDTTCAFRPTDANGLAEFSVDAEKVYEVHVLQVPEGFRQDERSYETLDGYSDVSIFLERAE